MSKTKSGLPSVKVPYKKSGKEAGFTLIELSIVLVIIGLIVGGILVGQDMIKAAEIRGTISQIQKYDSAVNTFRTKYGYIPGDVPSATANNLGFYNNNACTAGLLAGTTGAGDGNGLLEGGSAGSTLGEGETIWFWRHLTDASLVDGNFGTTAAGNPIIATSGATCGQVTTALTSGTVGQIFPPAKLGVGNYIATYSATGKNYFELVGMSAMTLAGQYTLSANLTPLQAYTIDIKIDDGLPLTGSVQAMNSTGGAATLGVTAGAGAAGQCTVTSIYDTTTSGPSNSLLCQLSIGFN